MTLHGHIESGRVVLDSPRGLPDGTLVIVTVAPRPQESEEREIATLYERMKPIIGTAKDLPPGASQNIDHNLYGHPKK